jgi:hypothetical protein
VKAFYTSLKTHEIHHLKNLLESAGVRCSIRNEGLSTLAGEVPFVECAMQLVLQNESDRELAQAILREMVSRRPPGGSPWECPGCSERIESQFTACWHCGMEKA